MSLVVQALCAILLIYLLKYVGDRLKRPKHNYPLPPGPKPLPIIGNLLQLRAIREQGPDYIEWGKKYNSDILFASAFGNHVLILNKREDAEELMERRARFYSDRVQSPVLQLVGWGGMVSLFPYTDYWRKCRKIFNQHFNESAVHQYQPMMQEKMSTFLMQLLKAPSRLHEHNHMLSVSFAMALMYGYKVNSPDDPLIQAADRSLSIAGALIMPDGTIMHFLPFLAYIPAWLAGPMTSRKLAAEAHKLTTYLTSMAKEYVRKSLADGTAVSSIVVNFMKQREEEAETSEEDLRAVEDVAFTTYAGATDTTIAFTKTFFYLMAKYPDAQKKAQAELDRVVGTGRLPQFGDRQSLPYIEAIYREVMRWTQSLPMGLGHLSTEDDIYKGFYIPKGTAVYANVWAMAHNPDVYEDPYAFKPERFFDINGKLNDDSRALGFGFGRRICAGKALANSFSWYMIASSLACFNISQAKDNLGREIPLNDEYEDGGIFLHKKDYVCSVLPRSEIHEKLIIAECTN